MGQMLFFFSLLNKNGRGSRTRTYEMPESKSGALPTWLYPYKNNNDIKKWGG